MSRVFPMIPGYKISDALAQIHVVCVPALPPRMLCKSDGDHNDLVQSFITRPASSIINMIPSMRAKTHPIFLNLNRITEQESDQSRCQNQDVVIQSGRDTDSNVQCLWRWE
jgi:hypothetical protein